MEYLEQTLNAISEGNAVFENSSRFYRLQEGIVAKLYLTQRSGTNATNELHNFAIVEELNDPYFKVPKAYSAFRVGSRSELEQIGVRTLAVRADPDYDIWALAMDWIQGTGLQDMGDLLSTGRALMAYFWLL